MLKKDYKLYEKKGYTFHHIAIITEAEFLSKSSDSGDVQYLLFDSRKLAPARHALFFALEGEKRDGHDYIDNLYQNGIRAFVIHHNIDVSKYKAATFLKVKNTLRAFQKISTYHRETFDYPVIGITGSNGKTIVKEWLDDLLSKDYSIVKSPKSYNSQIGVPLSIWQMEEHYQLGIFEAGISEVKEMEHLEKIIQPTLGIFTNIGAAHSKGFKNKKEKVEEKLKLFRNVDKLIYCSDYKEIDEILKDWDTARVFSWSYEREADLEIETIEKEGNNTILTAFFDEAEIIIKIPFVDDASIENAIHCWAMLLYLGIDNEDIAHRMLNLKKIALRLELKQGVNNCILVNDSYSADINSLSIALDFLAQQNTHKNSLLILSDILESGQSKKRLYKRVATLILQKKVTELIGIGDNIPLIKDFLPKDFEMTFYDTVDTFLKEFKNWSYWNKGILIKGARRFGFERIAQRLTLKVHKTRLEIDLNAVAHNLNSYRKRLLPSTKLMVMVKASGYGSGGDKIAKLLEYQQVDYLAVAYVDEGITLRKAGIKLPIMVLNADTSTFEALVEYNLEPEIYSYSQFLAFAQFIGTTRTHSIHLKINTGMNRLGFDNVEELFPILKAQEQLKVKSIISHLAASDNPIHDDFTHQQIQVFEKACTDLSNILGYKPIRHILNSSGISRFGKAQFDMVRLGIGLYGIDAAIQDDLQVVSALKATISKINIVNPPATIGYNRMGQLLQKSRIAVVSIGYADGLLRLASNGRFKVWVKGHLVPIIGNICMDMCMIDVTNIDNIQEGDEVVIFGKEHSIQVLANALQTIPYEVLTNISERVKRVYFQE